MSNKSTGPRTEEGKARSPKCPEDRHLLPIPVIPGEDLADHENLTREYYLRYQPFTPAQRDLLDRAIQSVWMLRRFSRISTQISLYKLPDLFKPNPSSELGQAFLAIGNHVGRLQRLINSTQRNFDLAISELERLQKTEPEPQPEPPQLLTPPAQFVPSTPSRPPLPHHYTDRHDQSFTPEELAELPECPLCWRKPA